ncbi:MerR-family transcriptional regulator (fragment) [Mesorhizobium delmotii]|uniref:MerR-family transcriptional regulator n=1 Tax=Mesorhizobium delmotii TaxID=1631247 RepID=A0A2P9AFP4_9HYPH
MRAMRAWARQSERSAHYQRVYKPQNRMLETLRNRSDNVESKMTPKLDRAFVGTHHAVELHGRKPRAAACPRPRAQRCRARRA